MVKMLILGPVIGCIREGYVTVGMEVSCNTDVSIHIHNAAGDVISSYAGEIPYGRLYTIDMPLHVYSSVPSRYAVSIHASDATSYGSFLIGGNVAAISCNNRHLGRTTMWDRLAVDKSISTCIHMGDNIYMDYGSGTFNTAVTTVDKGWDYVLDVFRQAYRDLWSTTHMHSILSSCSNIFMWDDHDVCDSWDQHIHIDDILSWADKDGNIVWEDIASSYAGDHRRVAILAAIQVYCEYQLPLSLGGRVHVPGSYTYSIGDRTILFMDRRSHRALSTPLIPSTLEGKPDVIVTGVPVFFIHPFLCNRAIDWIARHTIGIQDVHDQWCLDREDMEAALTVLKDGSMILCGDVHMCGSTSIVVDGLYTCIQVTSSGISTPSPPRIIHALLRMLPSYCLTVGDSRLQVRHSSWTRRNGYITFNTYGSTTGSIEYHVDDK